MNDIMRDLTAIATAIIGVAMIAVLVRRDSKTAEVIRSAGSAFGGVLGVAMGTPSNNPYGGF